MIAFQAGDAWKNIGTFMASHLFFVGNKRSGTSLLVQLLNLHPEVFITPESDIVWILYQLRNGWPDKFCCYPWDGPVGMQRTLQAASAIFESARAAGFGPETISQMFEKIQEQLRSKSEGQTSAPQWLGDKKPVQQCDPEIRPFLRQHFPEARYLHIIRDPAAVVASKVNAVKGFKSVPEFWRQSPEAILERWAVHEEWVLEARKESPNMVSLRFEDLCLRPVEEMKKIFDFLGLQMPAAIANRIGSEVRRSPNKKYDDFTVEPSTRVRRIMDLYGYSRA